LLPKAVFNDWFYARIVNEAKGEKINKTDFAQPRRKAESETQPKLQEKPTA
jgi:hypothetical protein